MCACCTPLCVCHITRRRSQPFFPSDSQFPHICGCTYAYTYMRVYAYIPTYYTHIPFCILLSHIHIYISSGRWSDMSVNSLAKPLAVRLYGYPYIHICVCMYIYRYIISNSLYKYIYIDIYIYIHVYTYAPPAPKFLLHVCVLPLRQVQLRLELRSLLVQLSEGVLALATWIIG